MTTEKIQFGRRSFIKSSVLAGGGLMLGFNWLALNSAKAGEMKELPAGWSEINSFLKINEKGEITIISQNPEFGSGVKTSMPMVLAEELDADWEKVIVEQGDFNPKKYGRQFTGGSMALLMGWQGLRKSGATARYMLMEAAAKAWNVPVSEITTKSGILYHKSSGKFAGYGEMASAAATIPVPTEVKLKDPKEFTIIGTSKKNVDGLKLVTGKLPFTMDYAEEGMLIAMVVIPPAFGLKLKSFDAKEAKAMPGIKDIFSFKTYNEGYKRNWLDTNAFPELIAVVGNSVDEVESAKYKIKAEWEPISETQFVMEGRRGDQTVTVPAGLESTSDHKAKMKEAAAKPGRQIRKDGNPEEAFKKAAKTIERTFSAPFLSHFMMEPINAFAHVTDDKAFVACPTQIPDTTMRTLSARLGLPPEKIEIKLTRMGGGFGRHSYAHSAVEAAVISQTMKAPVKLVYNRKDTTMFGVFRPAYYITYRAALDEQNNLIAYHVKAGGIPESPLRETTFPAGAVENYLAEDWTVPSNITVGFFRAPGSNFIGGAEQSFLDEVAELAGKDPIEFRLELLKRAKENPVGKQNNYDVSRYAGVLELVREKSNWTKESTNKKRGVAAYFCHNSYAAHVMDVEIKDDKPVVLNVYSVLDCGIVVNPNAAANMVEGNVVDAIGMAMYGEMTFTNGKVDKDNFSKYRMIRNNEAPKNIEVYFVQNGLPPTGLGEPPYPPAFAALANALYKATGKRYYHQPYIKNSFDA
ncbi:MAG: molybdopterin cofactor-binding domain-containing protein [Bacteroidales bacterium]